MKYDVISFGSATLDVFIKSPDLKVAKSNEVYTGQALIVPYGAKCEVEKLVVCSGGGGTNTAVGFSRLGLKQRLLPVAVGILPVSWFAKKLNKKKLMIRS